MACCLVSSAAEAFWLPLPPLCSQATHSRPKTQDRRFHQHTLLPTFPPTICVKITQMTTARTSGSFAHTHSQSQWNALLFLEWDSQENRVEVSVLKIQEPGSSAGAKNSAVLLPSQSALLMEEREGNALLASVF